MKAIKFIKSYLAVIIPAVMLSACVDDEIPTPGVGTFQVFEIVEDAEGNQSLNGPLTTVSVGQELRFEVESEADVASIWIGEYQWLPYGSNDSLPDSRNYMHYGMEGARGFEMTLNEVGDGFFYDDEYRFASPAEGWPVTIVTTNHGFDDTDYKQTIHEVGSIVVTP